MRETMEQWSSHMHIKDMLPGTDDREFVGGMTGSGKTTFIMKQLLEKKRLNATQYSSSSMPESNLKHKHFRKAGENTVLKKQSVSPLEQISIALNQGSSTSTDQMAQLWMIHLLRNYYGGYLRRNKFVW